MKSKLSTEKTERACWKNPMTFPGFTVNLLTVADATIISLAPDILGTSDWILNNNRLQINLIVSSSYWGISLRNYLHVSELGKRDESWVFVIPKSGVSDLQNSANNSMK